MKKIILIMLFFNVVSYGQWVQMSNGIGNEYVYSLTANGNNVIAGTANGVFISTNYGTNWTQTSLNNGIVCSIALNGNNIFAGTYLNGFYLSSDNGISWTQRNEGLGNPTIRSLYILNNYIFAGTYNNILSL